MGTEGEKLLLSFEASAGEEPDHGPVWNHPLSLLVRHPGESNSPPTSSLLFLNLIDCYSIASHPELSYRVEKAADRRVACHAH